MQRTKNNVQIHSSNLFHFDTSRDKNNELVYCEITSEWSMLQGHVDGSKIAIESATTGKIVEFERITCEYFDDEVISEKFVPISENFGAPVTLEIFND